MSETRSIVILDSSENELRRHLVHASDADQAEALLTRWGPEGQGKVGGSACLRLPNPSCPLTHPQIHGGPTPSKNV